MIESISNFINSWLGPLDILLGVIITVQTFWTWRLVLGEKKRRKNYWQEIRTHKGLRPAIMVVDLLEKKDVTHAVEQYRVNDDDLKSIPDNRVFRIIRDQRLTPDQMPALHDEIRQTAARIMESGADKVHYFHAGPAVVAAIVGAEFANSCTTLIYQFGGSTGYENFGPIRSF